MKSSYAYLIYAGCLALTASAPAEIIWSGEQNISDHEQYLDLNSDSLVDVILTYTITSDNSLSPVGYGGFLEAKVDGYGVDGSNRILVKSLNSSDAALPYGTVISGTPDASHEWKSGMFASGLVSSWSTLPPEPDTEWRGLLGEYGNTYIGIAFEAEGSTHYGWVNIALGEMDPVYGFENPITTSWAYESTPDTAIVAGAIPEPSTAILTTFGSLAMLFLARSRQRGTSLRTPLRKWS